MMKYYRVSINEKSEILMTEEFEPIEGSSLGQDGKTVWGNYLFHMDAKDEKQAEKKAKEKLKEFLKKR